ncbi:MAG: Rieske 2Fe-2S domain-containing protein [Planctomycetota bacterium]
MSVEYKLVQWNRHKRLYDLVIASAIALYLVLFVGVGMAQRQSPGDITPPILVMRALGTCAVVLLHVILLIGPAARLDDRLAPLLYNRRHLGVSFFIVAFLHALIAIGFYGLFGPDDPFTSLLVAPAGTDRHGVPFELFGFFALLIFFVMASTSHDFWLKNLSPRVWKSLHMLVYVAYGCVVLHVALGALQAERSPLYPALLGVGVVLVSAAHIMAAFKERAADAKVDTEADDGWIDAGAAADIQDKRARTVCIGGGTKIAVFRDGDRFSAISNICRHQGGPLGEGQIIDGCVTCPWHGYQYRAESGQSPPPYTEKVETYELRIQGGRVFVNPEPNAPGTPVEPARFGPAGMRGDAEDG